MAAVVIGALRVDLGLSTASFKKDANAAARTAEQLGKKVQNVGKGIAIAGAGMSAAITAPLGILIKDAIPAGIAANEALGLVEAGLKSMGPVAGRTSEQLQDMAVDLQNMSTFDDTDILRGVTSNMLTFGNIQGEVFDRAQKAVVDMSARLGTDLQGSAIQVGKALNDPIKGVSALADVGVSFSEEQTKMIKKLTEGGRAAEAQAIILSELEKQYGGSAQAMRDAAPGSDMVNQWDDLKQTIGQMALEFLPPLTDALGSVLSSFNSLSPETKKLVLGVALAVAAIGPLLVGLGAVVSAIGTLIATGPAIAGFFAAIKAASMTLLASPLGIVIGLVGAVVAAWYYWDEIVAVVDKVGAAVSDWYSANIKPTVDRVLDAIGSIVDFFRDTFGPVIQKQIDFYSALFSGDFAGAFEIAKEFATAALGAIGTAFLNLHTKAIEAIGNLVRGVGEWIQGKLGKIFGWLKEKVDAAAGWFFNMYDAVVGHSYVPDMIDGIEAEFARLDSVMVDKAAKTTETVKEKFRRMAGELRGLLDRLFPEIGEANQYRYDIRLIEGSDLDDAAKAEARRRLRDERYGEMTPTINGDDYVPLIDQIDWKATNKKLDDFVRKSLPDFSKRTAEETAKVIESFAGMAKNVLGSVRGMIDGFKSGDIIGGLMGLADLVSQVFGAIGAIKGGGGLGSIFGAGGGGYGTGGYGGPRALGGAVMAGKTYRVGERGPEYLTVGARGHITPDKDFRRGGVTANFYGVMTSDEFWNKIDELDNQAAARGAMGGANMVAERQARRGRQSLRG